MFKALLAISILILTVDARATCYKSFDELLQVIITSDKALEDNSVGFYVEELVIGKDGSLVEKQKLSVVPEKYKYQGRIFPNKSQQQSLGISTYLRRVVLNNVRVVTERLKDGSEPSSYWFWKENGCWQLKSRAVNRD